MRRLVDDLGGLARRRWVTLAAVLLAAGGFGSGSLPLLDAPGYELGMAGAWVAVLLAAPLGLAAARIQRGRTRPSPGAAASSVFLVLSALLALLFLGNAARAALGPCRVLLAAALFPLLALPSAALASAVAVVAALAAGGRRVPAALLYAGAVLASLGLALRDAYLGPQAFVLDPLLGWWPGPLYDEALRPDARLVLAQIASFSWAVAIVAAAEAAARTGRGTRAAPMLVVAIAAGAAVSARAALATEGLDGSRTAIAAALGGHRDGRTCSLVYPGEKPAAFADAFLADCDFHAGDVARALGLAAPPHVTVYLYRSAAEKRRLVGAAATDYTKPWLGEIHVLDAPLPHPTLRHELVHAVAAEIAPGPLHVPARAGVLVFAGLVEGLAVALEVPHGEWTIHQWTRAMRDEGLLPDVAALVGPAGFFRAPPARAYTAAGSFLRFLLERRGAGAIGALYRTGDFAAVGAPLASVAAEWSRFLDGVEVPPALAAAARHRFRRGSLFARRCAREAAQLDAEAAQAAAGGRAREACTLWRAESALSGSAWSLLAASDALARAGELARADAVLGEAAARPATDDAALARAIDAARGDLAWRAGDPGRAARWYAAALATAPERAEARLLEAKVAACSDPALGRDAREFLLGEGDAAVALARLAASPSPLAAYLVGRASFARGEASMAAPLLARAADARLTPEIELEARFLAAEARCRTGDASAGEAGLAALAAGGAAADRERAQVALRRCAFDARSRSGDRRTDFTERR